MRVGLSSRRASSAIVLCVTALGALLSPSFIVRGDDRLAAPAAPGTAAPGADVAPVPPARGPADLINRARQAARDRSLTTAPATRSDEVAGAAARPAEVPAAPGGAPDSVAVANGPAPDPHAGMRNHTNPHAMPRATSVEQADLELPIGTVRVQVIDADDRPVAGTEVRLGVLGSDGERSEKHARTGADGYVAFEGLAVGERQAYRVTVPHEGARYGSSPFRLPPRGGFAVTIRRLPVTRDDARVVLYLGATSIELRDERIAVVQQARLVNLDTRTYVFPEGGRLVRLPTGFTAFQAQESMGDQRVRQSAGEGLRVEGSIPPGEATLLWGFDLPIESAEMRFAMEIPWRTFAYRVIADAPPGLRLSVEQMPEPWLHEEGGRRFFVTELQRKVGEPSLARVRVVLTGIPGPGPLRWIAAALALVMLAAAGVVAFRRSPATAPRTASVEARRGEILARAAELDTLRRAGEIGPEHHAEESARLVDALARLLAEQDAAHATCPAS
jgi:hypothetical protein